MYRKRLRLRVIALVGILGCLGSSVVFAEPTATFALNMESGRTEFKITANPKTEVTVQFWDASDPVVLENITYENVGKVLKYATQILTDSKGSGELIYNIKFPTGNYRVQISDGSEKKWSKDFYFFSEKDKNELIENLQSAFKDANMLRLVVEKNAELLNLDMTLYEQLKKDKKDIDSVYRWLGKQTVPKTLDEFKAMFSDAMIVSAFSLTEKAEEVKNYFRDYSTELGINENYQKMYDENLSEALKTKVCQELADYKEFENINSIVTLFARKSMFYSLYENSYLKIDDILLKGKELIGEGIYNKYYALSTDEQKSIAKKVCKNTDYSNFDDWKNEFEKLINNPPDGDKDNNHGDGGGNTSRPPKNNTPQSEIILTEPKPKEDISAEIEFSDLENFTWAEDAIRQLAKAKIVFGKEKGKFFPQEAVTREEFLAILIRAFEIEISSGDTDFSDVKRGKWYYDAIVTAQRLKLTEGIGGGQFGIGQKITRQEMCVLAYRFAINQGVKFEENTVIPFSDNVAKYAEEAIAALYQAKIVSGVGGSEFLPEMGANRAEAAKIVYLLLSFAKRI